MRRSKMVPAGGLFGGLESKKAGAISECVIFPL
jgi:hypothetical protein